MVASMPIKSICFLDRKTNITHIKSGALRKMKSVPQTKKDEFKRN